MNKPGLLIVFSGPSGVGKGTILGRYMRTPGSTPLEYSISATTRAPRMGEEDGVHYRFLTTAQFEEMIGNGEMLEYAQYNGNYYGTPKAFVQQQLAAGHNVLLEIEVQGAAAVRQQMPDALFVFVMPPSLQSLRQRLEQRGTEDAATIARRVAAASDEICAAKQYDYIIVNDDLDLAAMGLGNVIEGAKYNIKYQLNLIDEVLNNA